MARINISIFVESRYQVNRKRLRKTVESTLDKQGASKPVDISIAVVGDRKMRELSKKYKGEDKTRNVLSFSLSEGEATKLPTDVISLGDIVVSYPEIIREASRDDMLVDEKMDELVLHGLSHLLGIHHE